MFCCCPSFLFRKSDLPFPHGVDHCDLTVVYRLSDSIFDSDPFPFTTHKDWLTRHSRMLVTLCMHRVEDTNPPLPCRFYSIPPHVQSYVPLNRDSMLWILYQCPRSNPRLSVAFETSPIPTSPGAGRNPHSWNASREMSPADEHVPVDLYRFG